MFFKNACIFRLGLIMRNCFVTILNILNAVVMVLKLLTVFALVLFVLVFYNVHIGFNYVYNVYIFHLGLNCDDICLFVSLCFFCAGSNWFMALFVFVHGLLVVTFVVTVQCVSRWSQFRYGLVVVLIVFNVSIKVVVCLLFLHFQKFVYAF